MVFDAFDEWASRRGVPVSSVVVEAQNSDYESGLARIDGQDWHVRTARTTPTKPGAFLAFWRRRPDGATAPFERDAVGAGLLVFVRQQERRGVFAFTAAHLDALDVTAGSGRGKRGFRVYPSWCGGLNPAALATQRRQAPAFEEF
ncbi:MepB family protein [Mycetocola reblochoni]|uniref:Metallopeptidase n=2 Tax=Mycetocola reblochoni TaxID=331618 RepID=A0A1R4IA22_9MICO|nr:MepB family protein [Mycetocola reblochoni]RLP70161.1 metallopeptidase [Mycetocola reblochoni]SJN16741.1 hypothetical protein FM119_00650 [Mycetocola reblochoni REB411]